MYGEAIAELGHSMTIATGGVECVSCLRSELPGVLVLETSLLWGGSEGVLEVAQRELGYLRLPVILVAVGVGPIDWFQLSRYRIDDILFRIPSVRELGRAIAGVTGQQEARGSPNDTSAARRSTDSAEAAETRGPPRAGTAPHFVSTEHPLYPSRR